MTDGSAQDASGPTGGHPPSAPTGAAPHPTSRPDVPPKAGGLSVDDWSLVALVVLSFVGFLVSAFSTKGSFRHWLCGRSGGWRRRVRVAPEVVSRA